jgi:DNA-binding CsgD family transcriptional regulator
MVQTTALRSEEATRRLFLRSATHTLERVVAGGTSCSQFEAAVIAQKAKEVFRLGEYNDDHTIQPGQLVWRAIKEDEPPGKPLTACVFKTIRLTVHALEEDREVLYAYGRSAKRGQQCMRTATEALDQGALLTQEDLAEILDSDPKTIRTDIKRYQQKYGILIPTRGNKKDIGPGITHREKAVALYLQGKDPVAIGRDLQHSLKAVERYLQTFRRVVYCQGQMRNSLKTAMVVGVSVALVNRYLALRDKFIKTEGYKERIGEIEDDGARFWEYQDGKKKSGSTSRRPS